MPSMLISFVLCHARIAAGNSDSPASSPAMWVVSWKKKFDDLIDA